MKKIVALLLVLAIALLFTVSAFAVGEDDGSLTVAQKDGKKYLGVYVKEGFSKYTSAEGSNLIFYDINQDKNMDICDLVMLDKNEIDLDCNARFNSADGSMLRTLIIKGEF